MVPVPVLDVDLLGDGRGGTELRGIDLRLVAGVFVVPDVVGTYQLQVRVTDACGRSDATGAARPVTVR